MASDISILIPSCDNYSDIWGVLAQSYDTFWKDCPYKKYIITNGEKEAPKTFEGINVGPDIDWSSNVIAALGKIDSPYILMHIDDLILTSSPNQEAIDKYIGEFIEKDGDYIKLLNTSKSKTSTDLIKIQTEAPYRTSTVFSLWKKEVLLDILKEKESPWALEVEGTQRSKKYKKWYLSPTDCFTFENMIIKGVIEPKSLWKIKKIGLTYSGERKVMGKKDALLYSIKGVVFHAILLLPNNTSRKMVEFVRNVSHRFNK